MAMLRAAFKTSATERVMTNELCRSYYRKIPAPTKAQPKNPIFTADRPLCTQVSELFSAQIDHVHHWFTAELKQ